MVGESVGGLSPGGVVSGWRAPSGGGEGWGGVLTTIKMSRTNTLISRQKNSIKRKFSAASLLLSVLHLIINRGIKNKRKL